MASEYAKVTAIVRADRLERVERALQDEGASGVSVSQVKGYGEYVDFFASDWMSTHVRVEVITGAFRAGALVQAILGAASTGTKGDGIVFLTPVERAWRVRSRSPVPPSEL